MLVSLNIGTWVRQCIIVRERHKVPQNMALHDEAISNKQTSSGYRQVDGSKGSEDRLRRGACYGYAVSRRDRPLPEEEDGLDHTSKVDGPLTELK